MDFGNLQTLQTFHFSSEVESNFNQKKKKKKKSFLKFFLKIFNFKRCKKN